VIPREGVWDELGYDDAKKDTLRGYFETESQDPYLAKLNAKGAVSGAASAVTGGGA
jgi:hypothetical protein